MATFQLRRALPPWLSMHSWLGSWLLGKFVHFYS
jgi:hypothetical protein